MKKIMRKTKNVICMLITLCIIVGTMGFYSMDSKAEESATLAAPTSAIYYDVTKTASWSVVDGVNGLDVQYIVTFYDAETNEKLATDLLYENYCKPVDYLNESGTYYYEVNAICGVGTDNEIEGEKKKSEPFSITINYYDVILYNTVTGAEITTDEGGTTTGAGSYKEGTTVTLTAEMKEGYCNLKWNVSEGDITLEGAADLFNPKTTITFTMPGNDVSITAEFGPHVYLFNDLGDGTHQEQCNWCKAVKGDPVAHFDGDDQDELCDLGCGYDHHVHTFDILNSDDAYHWYECGCGSVKEETYEEHTLPCSVCTVSTDVVEKIETGDVTSVIFVRNPVGGDGSILDSMQGASLTVNDTEFSPEKMPSILENAINNKLINSNKIMATDSVTIKSIIELGEDEEKNVSGKIIREGQILSIEGIRYLVYIITEDIVEVINLSDKQCYRLNPNDNTLKSTGNKRSCEYVGKEIKINGATYFTTYSITDAWNTTLYYIETLDGKTAGRYYVNKNGNYTALHVYPDGKPDNVKKDQIYVSDGVVGIDSSRYVVDTDTGAKIVEVVASSDIKLVDSNGQAIANVEGRLRIETEGRNCVNPIYVHETATDNYEFGTANANFGELKIKNFSPFYVLDVSDYQVDAIVLDNIKEVSNLDESPSTGDNSNTMFLLALMALSGCSLSKILREGNKRNY